MSRSNYVIALELTTMSPLTHGAGNDGNSSIARTTEFVVDQVDPETMKRASKRIRVPIVSGAAFRSTLREHAFGHLAEVLGLQDGDVSLDQLRLLLKGGKNDSGGASVSLEEARRMRTLFPMLAVFGSMDGGLPIRGEIMVSQIVPVCQELVEAGHLPLCVSAVSVSVDGAELIDAPQILLHEGRMPVPLHQLLTEENFFRHDMRTSPHAPLLGGAVRAQVEDKAAARKGKVAGKEERREANESMPYTMEAIPAGVPLVATLRLNGATQMEWECLCYAITRWVAHGALLGGATGKGHGQCRVRVAGALAYTPPSGGVPAPPGTSISVDRAGDAYVRHVREHAEQLRTELAKVTRGAGKSPKAAAEPVEAA